MYILGINGGVRWNNQDASACLLKDSKLIAAAEEERFLKIKFATGVLPRNAIIFCLQFANISMQDISYVVFPGITYNDITRILETYIKFHFGFCPKVKVVDHHMAHAASVFYTSAFDESMIITADLTGDGKSTTLCYGSDDKISVLRESFMTIIYNVRPDKVKKIPTHTHVDNTARIQTVSKSQNGLYYDLISNFENETGIPIVTNTSLNVRDQPICLSPVDALSTFYSTGMDGIAIGNCLLLKGDG